MQFGKTMTLRETISKTRRTKKKRINTGTRLTVSTEETQIKGETRE